MSSKPCFKCGAFKPLDDFYKHPQMRDGHLNKCKDCSKADSYKNRWKNIDRVREYDRERGGRHPPEYYADLKKRFPQKYRARNKVNNALRRGVLVKADCCEACGSGQWLHGHHDDYSKPLDVRWLCAACHAQWHRDNGPWANAEAKTGESDGT